jgi:hypothetical protein
MAQVIPGWEMAIKAMRKGQIAYVLIPADLAYGSEGFGDLVPPNSPLVFKIELIDIVKETGQAIIDPFGQDQAAMPDFDRHTPGFQKAWKEQ